MDGLRVAFWAGYAMASLSIRLALLILLAAALASFIRTLTKGNT